MIGFYELHVGLYARFYMFFQTHISMICAVGFYDIETDFYGLQCHRNQLCVSKKTSRCGVIETCCPSHINLSSVLQQLVIRGKKNFTRLNTCIQISNSDILVIEI
jgi:hypothetical protein